jgi:DNA-binding NarL/FixJ family response regulator
VRSDAVIRVAVVDDQAVVRAGFHTILSSQPDIVVVGEAADGIEALQLVNAEQPDVVLMDIRMPRLDGIEATRRMSSRNDPVRVLIMTTFDLDEYVYEALRAGASGFLLKDLGRDDLVTAVRTVAAGEAIFAAAVTRRLIDAYVERRPPSHDDRSRLDTLTGRERDVLERVARGMSNAEIAADLVVGEATVKSHVANMLLKLDVRSRVHAVIAAYELGVIAPGELGRSRND